MKRLILFVFAGLTLLSSCKKDEEPEDNPLDTQLEEALVSVSQTGEISFFEQPESDDFASIPQDPNNPLNAAKVELGKMLFHETALAVNPVHSFSQGTYSCASCHMAAAGFQAGRFQGLGDGGVGFGEKGEGRSKGSLYTDEEVDAQPLRTPAALNTAFQENMLWDGRLGVTAHNVGTEALWGEMPAIFNESGFHGVETQALAALKVHRLVDEENADVLVWYQTYFNQAFPEVPAEERYTTEKAALAIAAYERTILANKSPFQRWLKGDKEAMTDNEKRGALVFFKKGQCATCHTGPALNTNDFHAIGMKDLDQCPEDVFVANPESPANRGRGSFTNIEDDYFKFKVPQLYNLEDSKFFGHGSSLRSIRAVVEYKNRGVKENNRVWNESISSEFKPLNLSEAEIENLTRFLETSLYDNDLMRYQPSSVLSGNCFPNNDPISRNQMDCN